MRFGRLVGLVAVVGAFAATLAAPTSAAPPAPSNSAFDTWWSFWDQPVQSGKAARSWLWGNDVVGAPPREHYVEGQRQYWTPDGQLATFEGERDVRYVDKARMEYWPDRSGQTPDENPWKVTTGLLATELMTGRLQLGDTTFEQHHPSQVPVAGDPDSGDVTPSYADMGNVIGYQPTPNGWTIIQTIDARGTVGAQPRYASFGVTAQAAGSPTGHTVALVFWVWMNQTGLVYHAERTISGDPYAVEPLFSNPFSATGYPTTEAYWTTARVAGVERDVLVQCFERRCMTYTPSNPSGWKVEMGNIGQHYLHWRYVEIQAE